MIRTRLLATVLAAGSLAPAFSLAQPPAAAQPSRQPAPSAPPAQPIDQRALGAIAARQLAGAALIDCRGAAPADATPGDARYLAALLRDAAALDPENPFILRYAIDACAQAGDLQAALALSRTLVGLDPEDTAAQLDLIRARVSTCQSAEERLAILDAFLGPRGESLDGSIRSRLAIDAALLREEMGDATGFNKDLAAAISFDPSNTGAAAKALQYYAARAKDAEGRFELLANALLSAPLDASLHAAIADELSAAGATDQALRFYDNASNLYRRQGSPLPIEEETEKLIQFWKSRGPAYVVKPLNDAVDLQRRQAQVDIDVANATGKPTDHLPPPNSFRQPIALERLRLLAAFAAGDRSTIDRSLTDYASSIEDMPPTDPARLTARIDAAYLRALTGSGDPATDLAAIRSTGGQNVPPEAIARLEAWSKLRAIGGKKGDRTLFESMKDDPWATVALLAADADATPAGDTDASRAVNDRLAALANGDPASPFSAWAYSVYQSRNGGKAPAAPQRAEKFAAMAAGIPAWLDDITREPSRFITVRVETPRGGLAPLEPAVLNVRVTNNTPVPLAVGPGHAIDSRVLLVSTVDIGGSRAPELNKTAITSLSGRLRLLPRESVVFPVWADAGEGAWAVQNAITRAARIRYSVVQGYQIVEGSPRPGPFGTVVDADPVGRASIPLGDVGRTTADVASLEDADFAFALLHARLHMLTKEKVLAPEQATRLVAAIIDRYKRGTSAERIAILTLTPTPRLTLAVSDLALAVAEIDEKDPMVVRAILLTRVDDQNSPFLNKFRNFPDPSVQEAVRVLEARNINDRFTFAKAVIDPNAPASQPQQQPPAPGATPTAPTEPADGAPPAPSAPPK